MLHAVGPHPSGVKTPEFAGLFGTAEQAAEKPDKGFLHGRFAPWVEAQGLQSPVIIKALRRG